jgi:hypothetical protein
MITICHEKMKQIYTLKENNEYQIPIIDNVDLQW